VTVHGVDNLLKAKVLRTAKPLLNLLEHTYTGAPQICFNGYRYSTIFAFPSNSDEMRRIYLTDAG